MNRSDRWDCAWLKGGSSRSFVAHSGECPPEAASVDGVNVSVLGSLWDTKEDLLSLGHKPMNLKKKVRGAKAPPKVDVSTPEGLRDAMARGLVTRTTLASRVAEFDILACISDSYLRLTTAHTQAKK